ncbi:MAG: outer membrane protein transport protein [Muribaculaceae bacterium]|nr:outer membrane protein transport protein [Muribaculaceae bacterium]
MYSLKNLLALTCLLVPMFIQAQDANDVYRLSQTDLKGTARFVSMAGAFGALGGDLSTLTQNPAGIGVYRSSDVGVSLNFDFQSATAKQNNQNVGATNQFKFNCNNAGYVGAYNLNSDLVPNFNWGFTYNRAASFNRHTKGGINNLNSSLSNYIAWGTDLAGVSEGDLATSKGFDPYQDGNAPWLSILAYDSYLINPNSQGENFQGLYGDGTLANGEFETIEEGGINEYSINLGGNIAHKIYWGLGFGITDINYESYTYYGESMTNAYITDSKGVKTKGEADYGLQNGLHTYGSGYNLKFGLIFKPVNSFRLGFAFHTPTYYSLKDEAWADMGFEYSNDIGSGSAVTNNSYYGESWYQIRTPWKFIASVAAIVGKKGIISFDYEYIGYQTMSVLSDRGYEYLDTKSRIGDYYKASSIFRIGGEYRVNNKLSVRAGYSYQTSPVNDEAYNNRMNIYASGTIPSYSFMKMQQYITVGLGYRYKSIYTDLAYSNQRKESEFHAFSPVLYSNGIEPSPTAKLIDTNNQLVFTFGLRF